jgi:ribosomal protein L3
LKFIELDDTLNDISTTIIKHDNNVVDQKKGRAQDKHRTAAPVLAEDIFDTMEEYKIHLQLLAKDLNKNEKVHHLDRLKKKEEHEEEGWRPRLKRSTSNPFLYFNERREEIMEVGALNNRPE